MYQAAGKTRELLSVRMIKILLVKFVVIPKNEQVACKVAVLSLSRSHDSTFERMWNLKRRR